MYDEKKVNDILAQNLVSLRLKHGLTQEELSNISGIHRPNLALMETAHRKISLETILRVCSALEEPICEFTKGLEDAFVKAP